MVDDPVDVHGLLFGFVSVPLDVETPEDDVCGFPPMVLFFNLDIFSVFLNPLLPSLTRGAGSNWCSCSPVIFYDPHAAHSHQLGGVQAAPRMRPSWQGRLPATDGLRGNSLLDYVSKS